jgi:molecular chaperone GrpE
MLRGSLLITISLGDIGPNQFAGTVAQIIYNWRPASPENVLLSESSQEFCREHEETMSEEVIQSETYPSPVTEEQMTVNEEQVIEADAGSQDSDMNAVESPTAEVAPPAQAEEELSSASADESEITAEAIARLSTEVETLRLQLEERTSLYMRIAADFDNFRKRTEREKGELELRVKRETLVELLPVIDSFDRARAQMKPQTEQEANIHQSYQGVYKQLVDCLKRTGVSPMYAEGQPFDPNYHDAILREPTDQYPEGTVIEELCRGYLLGELVLRHAMVKVATEPEAGQPTAAPSDSLDGEEIETT